MSCKFCVKPFGKEFKVNSSVNKFKQPDAAFLHLLEGDEAGIVLLKMNNGCGWFDIKYCPFCGEKLRSEENA